MSKINGTLVKVYVDADAIAYGTSAGISISMATREVTNKDSGGWSEFAESKLSGKIDFKGIFDDAAAFGTSDLFSVQTSRSTVTLKWGDTTSGKKRFESDAYITDLSLSSEVEGNVEFTCNFQLTGTISEITNP
jgi:predicted secreted protein